MRSAIVKRIVVALTAILGCSDGGTDPEWKDWEWFTIGGRVSVLIPPEWTGPEYTTYNYLIAHFRWPGGTFMLQQGPTVDFPYYLATLPGYRETAGVVDGRRVTEMAWDIVASYDTSYNVCLWVVEPDDDFTRYLVVSTCDTPPQREMVRKILERLRFLRPKLKTATG